MLSGQRYPIRLVVLSAHTLSSVHLSPNRRVGPLSRLNTHGRNLRSRLLAGPIDDRGQKRVAGGGRVTTGAVRITLVAFALLVTGRRPLAPSPLLNGRPPRGFAAATRPNAGRPKRRSDLPL
jgi:hypothetical protein